MNDDTRRVGLGVVGLGRGFTLMLPTLLRDRRFRLVAAMTPGVEARTAFERDFGGNSYETLEAMLDNPDVEAVYIASPHQFHCEQTIACARAGRHVLVDKPLALSVEDGLAMVAATHAGGVHLVVGPSHSFDAPALAARRMVASNQFGAVRMIHSFNYTDFLYRPRRPEELDSERGGGVIFSQAVHQVDVARLLAGGLVTRVRGLTGNWDPDRPTEGAYNAQLEFANGAFASLTYSGYGRFDSDEFMDWYGEPGHNKNPQDYGKARHLLKQTEQHGSETALKRTRNYGHVDTDRFTQCPLPPAHEHFGVVIISCERADLRLKADGVMVFEDHERRFEPVAPPVIPRVEVMDELYDCVIHNRRPTHSGAFGLATLEASLAILASAKSAETISMKHQVGVADT
ncbi:MAG: dehydrogenase [marine bacterium B5-7]|nr:MAG: dehydrogenase [marine bacterium B5-7]